MREILFRGKQIYDNGKWIIGHYACRYGTHYIYFPKTNPYSFDYEYIIPETVGQYTGLTDKNGIRIFEGDIVKVSDNYGYTDFSDGGIGNVGFYDGLWYVSGEVNNGLNDLTKVYYVEVIGNIHDNPELMKGESDNARQID